MLMARGATDPPVPDAEVGGQPGVELTAATDDSGLDRFRAEVAREQLAEWLPSEPPALLDLPPRCPRLLDLMVGRGHTVIHAVPGAEWLPAMSAGAGRLHRLQADG